MENQIAFNAQQQIAQAHIQKEVDKVNPEAANKEQANKGHEATMLDKKIELERIKSSKKPAAPAKKPAPKKKSVVKEAQELGLIYVGSNRYANSYGDVTHLNENGILVELNKE